MPYKSVRKRKKVVRSSVSKWYKVHKAERAAYMRKYRKRLRKERPGAVSAVESAGSGASA